MAQKGEKTSAETRTKISASLMGHPISEETRAKISVALTGQLPSVETRAKIGTKSLGRSVSIGVRVKISAAHTRHGHTRRDLKSCTYIAWQNMLQRCRDLSNLYYGGRGITVCTRWDPQLGGGFENFLTDMGVRPEGLTLDRIDPNRNYEPDNCRWATWREQRINQRRSQ